MDDDAPAIRLAKAALLALRTTAGAPSAKYGNWFTFLPHLKTLGAVDAAGFLAALPKPLMAVSFVTNEQLYIATWSRDKPHGLYNDVVEMFREALGTVREEGMRPDLADVIVASSDSIGVPLSSAEFERWMFDYDIPFATLAIGPSSTSAIPRSMLTATISRQTGDWINDLPLP